MEEYRTKIFRTHLDNEPSRYVPPTLPVDVLEVAMLKPEVKTVSVHRYPNEHIVVLEGNNLWFCHKVHITEKSNNFIVKNSEAITGRSIQFSSEPTEMSDSLVTTKKVKLTLFSHFANPIRKHIMVEQVILSTVIHLALIDTL